ncbi:hypothetical protein FM106_32200 [Brachybacterium faecium]|nr:hypothetical protein FM106_32200 [Brachybacterium faecium]
MREVCPLPTSLLEKFFLLSFFKTYPRGKSLCITSKNQ